MNRISETANFSIFLNVVFMIALMLNLCAIAYSSTTKTLRVTLLYFIKDQCMIFALFIALVKQII